MHCMIAFKPLRDWGRCQRVLRKNNALLLLAGETMHFKVMSQEEHKDDETMLDV